MKKFLLKYSTSIGLLLYAAYNITDHVIINVNDAIGLPVCLLSIAFIMVGLAYNGWCFGKRKNRFK